MDESQTDLLGPRPSDNTSNGGTVTNNDLGPRPKDDISNESLYVNDVLDQSSAAQKFGADISHILSAITGTVSSALSEDHFSGPVQEELRKAKILGPASGQGNIVQQFNEQILHPLIMTGELGTRLLSAGFGAYQAGVSQVGQEIGAPQLGNELAAFPEAFMGDAGTLHSFAKARELELIGDRSGNTSNIVSSDEKATPIPETPAPLTPDTVSKPLDVHSLARQIDPDTFQVFDALQERQNLLRDQINNLREAQGEPTPHPEAIAIQDKIDNILSKVNGIESRLTKKQAVNIDDLRGQLQEVPSPQIDTPEMAELRSQLQKNDYQLRDLAEPVSKAYDEARNKLSAEEIEGSPEINQSSEIDQSKEDPNTKEPAQPQEIFSTQGQLISSPEILNNIADSEKQKLINAGRSENEAELASQLVALHYQTMAGYFDGAKGTAEELYKAEAPAVEGPKIAPKKLTQADIASDDLSQTTQGKLRTFADYKTIIKLFKSADASTFIHETGHKWLSELMDATRDELAPPQLKELGTATRKWLGVSDDLDFSNLKNKIVRTAHEKWATAFERYLYDGEAPTPTLTKVFNQFREWLAAIKGKIEKLAPISDDIKDVFDKLITPNPERQPVGKVEPIAETLADIHEGDVKTTPPHLADHVADIINNEIHETVKGHSNLEEAINGQLGESVAGLERGGNVANGDETGKSGSEHIDAGGTTTTTAHQEVGRGDDAIEAEGAGGAKSDTTSAHSIKINEEASSSEQINSTNANQKFTKPSSEFVDKAGNIVLNNLNQPEDVLQAIKDAARENGNFFSARRGVLSLNEQMKLKEALGFDHIDAWKIGQAFNVEEILAARDALINSAANVQDAMRKAADSGDAGDILSFARLRARHMMIQEVISGITAEAGRALAAFRNILGFKNAKALSDFLRDTQGMDLFQMLEMAERGRTLKNAQQIGKFIDDSRKPTFKDKMIFYYVNALISGPLTHVRYAIGNAVNALITPLIEVPVAAAIGAGRETLGLEVKDRVYFGESGAQLYSLLKGAQDGLSAATEAFRSGQSPLLPGEKVHTNGFNYSKNPLGDGPIAAAISVPGRSVSAIHSFFKSLRYEQNIAGLAYRTAMNENLVGEEFNRRVAELTQRPSIEMITDAGKYEEGAALPKNLKENVDLATAETLKELYMRPTVYDSNMYHLDKFVNENLAAKIIVPFLKIGTEITRNAVIERTPLGFLNKDVRGRLLGEGAQADMQLAKVTIGTSLIGATSLMTLHGLVTGDGPADPQESAVWLLANHPNSIVIGNLSIPYQGLGPLGMLMRFSANVTQTAAGWNHDEGKSMAAEYFKDITESVLDESFMRGFHDLNEAVYDRQGDKAANYLRSFVTNWLPYSVGLGQVARTVDPYQRQVNDRGFENSWGILEAAQAKIPWLSDGLMPKRDVFGEPISGNIDKYKNDLTTQTLNNLQIGISRVPKNILGVQLSPEQYDDFNRIAGRYVKARLDSVIASPNFNKLKLDTQVDVIDKVIGASRKGAKSAIIIKYPDILKQATENAQRDVEN